MITFSWLQMEFNYAVQLGEGCGSNMFGEPPEEKGDTWEEHCAYESKPWRFV